MIKDYLVVNSLNVEDLMYYVNDKLTKGWILQGTMLIEYRSDKTYYYQVMVKRIH